MGKKSSKVSEALGAGPRRDNPASSGSKGQPSDAYKNAGALAVGSMSKPGSSADACQQPYGPTGAGQKGKRVRLGGR